LVGLPLQATVKGCVGFGVVSFVVVDFSHDRIEVTHDVGIALGTDHRSAALKGIQSAVVVLLIVTGQTGEVIKRHFIGVIEHTRLAERRYLLPVLFRPFVLYELETGAGIVGSKLQEIDQRTVEHRHRHLLERVVGHAHLRHIGVTGHHLLHTVEQSHHAERVALGVALLHSLLEKHSTRLCRRVLAQEHLCHHPVSQRILTCGAVIVIQGTLGVDIGRIGFQHLSEKLVSLCATLVLHEPVAQHHGETGIIGMTVGQAFQCFVCHLFVAHELVDTHLCQRERVVGTLYLLQTIDGVEHHRIVLLLFVELNKDVEHITAVAVAGKEALVGADGKGIVAGADIELSQSFLVGVVVRTEHSGPFQAFHRQCVLLELREIHGFEIPGLSRIGIDGQAMVEQIKGSIIVPGFLLADGLQEEQVIPPAVVIAQRRHCDSPLDLCFLGFGALAVLGDKHARHKQQAKQTEKVNA